MLGVMIRSLQTGHAIGQASSRSKFKFKPEPVLAAYHANVRSILEYGSVIWGGAAKTHLERLDRIQHEFLIWLASRSTQRSQNIDYDHLLALFKIPSLSMRRLQYDILFVHKIVSGMIDSTFLLGNFSLHVLARTTRAIAHTLFHVPPGIKETVRQGIFVARPKRSTNIYQHVIFLIHLTAHSAYLGLKFDAMSRKVIFSQLLGDLCAVETYAHCACVCT